MFKLSIIFILVTVALLTGCSQVTLTGSGNLVTQEEAISDFDKVDISQSFEVDIKQGESFSVVIRVDDNLVEHLQVVKQGSTLKIGLKDNRDFIISNATMEAEVTMPKLTGLDVSGASTATVNANGRLDVDASGSSNVYYLGNPSLGTIDTSGSSSVEAK